jgi:hypothetical protein
VLDFIAEHQLRIKPVWGEFPARPYESKAIWGDVTKLNAARAAAASQAAMKRAAIAFFL